MCVLCAVCEKNKNCESVMKNDDERDDDEIEKVVIAVCAILVKKSNTIYVFLRKNDEYMLAEVWLCSDSW